MTSGISDIGPEFKREALMRASEEGVTDIGVREELEIGARQLRRWRDNTANEQCTSRHSCKMVTGWSTDRV